MAFDTSKFNIKEKASKLQFNKAKSKLPKQRVEKPREVIAFDIGSNTIKVVEGKYSKKRLQVYRLMDIPTPKGAIEDGKIVNERDIVEAIKALLRRNNVKIKDGICTTNSSSIISRDLVIPVVEYDEMETVIRYEIEQFLPIRLEDYIIQYVILDKIVDNEGPKLKLNVVAYPNVVAKSYHDLLTALDLNPYVLDVNFNSLSKLSSYSNLTMEGTVAFVDMGATSMNISIFKAGKLDFSRIIKYGGESIDYALSTKLDMSIKSTESEKIEKGSLVRVSEDDIINKTISESVDEMLGELERILQFYNNQSVGRNLEKVVIYGGTSNLEGLDEYMQRKLNIKTEKINTLSGIDFTNRRRSVDSIGNYLNAIGSIIRL